LSMTASASRATSSAAMTGPGLPVVGACMLYPPPLHLSVADQTACGR
jgi:hypothetical protein